MRTVRVIKSRWLRGEDNSALLLQRGNKMCCIGFVARELGAKPKEIRGIPTLEDANHEACSVFAREYDHLLQSAYEINDYVAINDTLRMQQLRAIGKDMGIKFVFVDK